MLSKKKTYSKIFFRRSPKKRSSKKFSGDLQNFNDSKYCAVLEPRTYTVAIFEDLKLRGQGLDIRGQDQGLQNVSSRPRTSSRTPPLVTVIHLLFLEHVNIIFYYFSNNKQSINNKEQEHVKTHQATDTGMQNPHQDTDQTK